MKSHLAKKGVRLKKPKTKKQDLEGVLETIQDGKWFPPPAILDML